MKRILMLTLILSFLSAPAFAGDEPRNLLIPCSMAEARDWMKRAGDKDASAHTLLMASYCVAMNLQKQPDLPDALDWAEKGAGFAKRAVAKEPKDGGAHYLYSVLTGMTAEDEPWYDKMADGLKLVGLIEKEAAIAARLDPALDFGGPDRVLGLIYLEAPEPPLSIGSPPKSVTHFKRAVLEDGEYPANRLGLAKAYFKVQNKKKACDQLYILTKIKRPKDKVRGSDHDKGVTMYNDKCVGGTL